MAKEARMTGKDLNLTSVEFCPGLVVDTKIKMGAIWWLEDKYNLPLEKIDFAGGRVRDLANIIVALAIQHDHTMTEERAIDLFRQLTPDEARRAAEQVTAIFTVGIDAKNSQGAGPLVEEQPKA